MPGPGRNDPCPCGSRRKVKRCCGERRGPSLEQLARAHVAMLARNAARELADVCDDVLYELWDGLVDLPARDLSLLVTLPELMGPDLQHLVGGFVSEDCDFDVQALIRVAADVDTQRQRARLADALIRLRDRGLITRREAAAAILDPRQLLEALHRVQRRRSDRPRGRRRHDPSRAKARRMTA